MFDKIKTTLVLCIILVFCSSFGLFAQSPGESEGSDPTYTLGPTDQVRIWIWQEVELSATVTVRPDGKISLPLIGSIDAAGQTPEALEAALIERYRAYLDAPVVVVIVEQINSREISVLGEVARPGRYPLLQQLTVLDAVALAGGFTDYADLSKVLVMRMNETGFQRIQVDIKKILDNQNDIVLLQPGDKVYVQ